MNTKLKPEVNKELCDKVIAQLQDWKDAFLQDDDFEWEKSVGVTELTDQLENIMSNGHKCYASYLFNQLTESDKNYINNEFDVWVNFDELFAIYEI